MTKFINKVISRLDSVDSHVCIGLDSNYDRIPDFIKNGKSISEGIFEFNKNVIQATSNLATAYKINLAFYRAFGIDGMRGLYLTTQYLKKKYQNIPLLADYKVSDMGESLKMIKREIIDWLGFDCLMVTSWFGFDTVRELVEDDSCGVIVYVHDSNPTAAEFQEVKLTSRQQLYELVTEHVVNKWNTNHNMFVEAGATYPEQLKRVREIVGEDMPILTAGIGSQGGDIENIKGVFGKNRKRLIVNSSRGIIFAGEGKNEYFLAVQESAEKFRQNLLQASKK